MIERLTDSQRRALRALKEAYRVSDSYIASGGDRGSAPGELYKNAWKSLGPLQQEWVKQIAGIHRCTTMKVLCEYDLPRVVASAGPSERTRKRAQAR